jgi:hypothetical protein
MVISRRVAVLMFLSLRFCSQSASPEICITTAGDQSGSNNADGTLFQLPAPPRPAPMTERLVLYGGGIHDCDAAAALNSGASHGIN